MANTITRKAAPKAAAKAAPATPADPMAAMMAQMQAMMAELNQLKSGKAEAKPTIAKKAAAFEPEFVDLGTWDDQGKAPPAVKITIDGKTAYAWRTRKGTTAITWNKPPSR